MISYSAVLQVINSIFYITHCISLRIPVTYLFRHLKLSHSSLTHYSFSFQPLFSICFILDSICCYDFKFANYFSSVVLNLPSVPSSIPFISDVIVFISRNLTWILYSLVPYFYLACSAILIAIWICKIVTLF